jgi:hypothetical protein
MILSYTVQLQRSVLIFSDPCYDIKLYGATSVALAKLSEALVMILSYTVQLPWPFLTFLRSILRY